MSWATQVIPATINSWPSKTSIEGLVDQRTGKPIPGTPTSSVVVLAQALSPYTLSSADKGKVLAPATTAEFLILHPDGLGDDFTCSIAPTGLMYPTEVRKAGGATVSIKNSGFEIDNANNMANRFVLPGSMINIVPAGANSFTITGNAKRWQVVASHTGYSDSSTGGNLQITGVTVHECKMPADQKIYCVKAGFINAVGLGETAPTGPAQFAWAVAYPVGATPQRATFGGLDTVTVQGKTTVETDIVLLNTPVDANAFLESRAWNGVTTGDGAQSGKGSIRSAGVTDINKKEFFGATVTAGTSSQSVLSTARTSLADTTINSSSNSSNSIFRPAYIIGITDVGARAILPSSISEPSNGDSPTIGGSPYVGYGERVWGRTARPMLNLSCASAGITTLMQSTERVKALKYCSTAVLGDVQNDLNKGTIAGIRLEIAKLKVNQYFAGKTLAGMSTTPFVLITADQATTEAGQVAGTTANSQLIQDYNVAGAANAIPEFDAFLDTRGIISTEVSAALAVYKVAAGARSVSDAVTTAGSNIVTSATAAFTPADTGKKISCGNFSAVTGPNPNGIGTGVMTYISATQVSVTGTRSITTNYNAIATGTAAPAFIRSQEYTVDGTHMSQYAGEVLEAYNFTLPNL